MRPEIFTGPLIPDLGKAAGYGVALGLVAGYVLGGVYDIVGDPDLQRWGFIGSGLAGTFAVALILFLRVLG